MLGLKGCTITKTGFLEITFCEVLFFKMYFIIFSYWCMDHDCLISHSPAPTISSHSLISLSVSLVPVLYLFANFGLSCIYLLTLLLLYFHGAWTQEVEDPEPMRSLFSTLAYTPSPSFPVSKSIVIKVHFTRPPFLILVSKKQDGSPESVMSPW